jgi:hypothetical protein
MMNGVLAIGLLSPILALVGRHEYSASTGRSRSANQPGGRGNDLR